VQGLRLVCGRVSAKTNAARGAVESIRLSSGDLQRQRLHGLRHLLPGLPRTRRHHRFVPQL